MANSSYPDSTDTAADDRNGHLFRVLRWELLIWGVALLLGLVAAPLLTWVVGNRLLGPYTHGQETKGGSMGVLMSDFYAGLRHGDLTFWCVALGPIAIVMFVRLVYLLYRAVPNRPAASRD